MIPVTDDRGSALLAHNPEPHMGSVVLTNGEYGTAWQRHFVDGLWRSTRGGRAKTWAELCSMRGVVLVYSSTKRSAS